MPERFKVVYICKALYKCSALPLPLPFTYLLTYLFVHVSYRDKINSK